MSGEAVKVIVRVRPLNERENNLNCKNVIDIDSSRGQCSIGNPNDSKAPLKPFFFDGAYNVDSTTEQMYSDIVYPLVENVTEGYNGTIFAYGQTGCGKSFTMQGIVNPSTQRGVIPRAFDHIFETISLSENNKYLVHASYLEIYNEEIRDLLAKDVKAKLDLKEHPEKGVYVSGLSMHKVSNVNDCQVVMERGWKNRATGSTLMNVDSSRSHSIFTIYLEMFDTDDNGENHIKAGKLNLVDLAGSERQSKTGATGDRLKEATKINLSLSALGNVISALVDGKSKHIPYRDSKLTRMLQDSLGGNTKTLMIACLSPADNNYEETLSTLRYANRAKNIQNKPKINEDPKDALLREFQNEINRLKQMLAGQIPVNIDSVNTEKSMNNKERNKLTEMEREKIKAEYEAKLLEKERQYSAEAADKAKLKSDMEKLKKYYDEKLMQLDIKDVPNSSEVLRLIDIPSSNMSTTTSSGPQPIGHFEKSLENPNLFDFDLTEPSVVIVNPEGNYSAVEPQRAVHIRSVPKQEITVSNKSELLNKLQFLQSSMVGGEQINNQDIKDRHSKRLRHAEEKRRRLMESNEKMEDDGIMLEVFEDIQDELRVKSRVLQKEKNKTMNLIQDIADMKDEFHKEKCDYLESIRKLERDNKLLQMILEKVQPCIKRNCNYANIDKIRSQARYDDDTEKWILPQLKMEQTQLPNPDETVRDYDDENLYRKLSRKPDPSQEYFQSKKNNQLLNQRNSPNNINSNQFNGPIGYLSMNNSNVQKINEHQQYDIPNNYSNDLRAAEVHGQLQFNTDIPNRRGAHRLDAIQTASRKPRKKSSRYQSDNANNDF